MAFTERSTEALCRQASKMNNIALRLRMRSVLVSVLCLLFGLNFRGMLTIPPDRTHDRLSATQHLIIHVPCPESTGLTKPSLTVSRRGHERHAADTALKSWNSTGTMSESVPRESHALIVDSPADLDSELDQSDPLSEDPLERGDTNSSSNDLMVAAENVTSDDDSLASAEDGAEVDKSDDSADNESGTSFSSTALRPSVIKQDRSPANATLNAGLRISIAPLDLEPNFTTAIIGSEDVKSSTSGDAPLAWYQKSNNPALSIFYNVFIPFNVSVEAEQLALNVVDEQIKLVGSSYAGQQGATVFYNTLGSRNGLPIAYMMRLCKSVNLTCVHLQHFSDGFEEVTLQKVYAYCRHNPESRVMYMHSKGSFHPTKTNTNWRPRLLEAASSEMCIESLDGDKCNACGLQFYPTWGPFFPGNFWAAQCSYVKQLLPPKVYQQKMTGITAEAKKRVSNGRMTYYFYRPSDDKFGLDRYSSEQWVTSSPDLLPCDVSPYLSHRFWCLPQKPYAGFALAKAPRAAITNPGWYHNRYAVKSIARRQEPQRDNTVARVKDYFLLAGHLLRWFSLYGRAPGVNSWVWKWYPDGRKWRIATKRYGVNAHRAMNKMLRELRS